MSHHKVTIRKIADETDVPYRSLQSYFSGKHSMPIGVLIKVCSFLEISADWVLFGKHSFQLDILRETIARTFGDNIPSATIDKNDVTGFNSGSKNKKSSEELYRDSQAAAVIISGLYDVLSESDYYSSYRSEFFREPK